MAQDNPYLIEENPYLKKQEENPYLNIAPSLEAAKSTVSVTKTTPLQTALPTGEPTAEEIAAASKPAFITKQQVMGGAAPALEAIRPTAAPAPLAPKPQPKPSKLDFKEFDVELEKLTPKRTEPTTTPIVEGEMKAAFGMYPKQPYGGRTQALGVETTASSPALLDVATQYLKVRQPNKELPKDPTQIVKNFRSSFVRGDIAKVDELTWAMNASPDEKTIARKAYELSEKLGTPLLEEVRATLNPLESPLTYASGGFGWGVKQASLRGVSTAAKIALKPSTVVAGVEGVVGASVNLTEQSTKKELGLQEEISYSQLALSTALSAGLGKVTSLSIDTAKTGFAAPVAERMEALKAAKGKTSEEFAEVDRKWLDMYGSREKEIRESIRKEGPALFGGVEEKTKARSTSLDQISPQTDTTKAVLNDTVLEDIYKVTKQLLKDNPDLRFDLNETRVTQGMINALDKASPDMLQEAAMKAGVTPADFLNTFKVTLSDAGAVLQKSSTMAKFVQTLSVGDPELEMLVNRLYKSTTGIQYFSDKVAQAVSKVIDISVGLSTAAPSTAIANGLSAAVTMSLKTAGDIAESSIVKPTARVIEAKTGKSSLWNASMTRAADVIDDTVVNAGRMVNDLNGSPIPLTKERIQTDMGQIISDSFYLFTKMADGGFTAEMTDVLTKNTPRLSNMMTHMSTDINLGGVPQLINNLNAGNVAVDAAVRRPIFIDSVYRRMQELGFDYEEFVASGRPVPLKVLSAAAEDAMKMTFSYEFKNLKQLGEKGFEASAESAAAALLDVARTNPYVGSLKGLTVPFLRYTMNAIRYTYRMAPLVSGYAGKQELEQAAKLRDEGKMIEAAMMSYDGKRKVMDNIVGTSAVIAAMAYRDGTVQANQYRDQDGNIKDGSNFSPLVQIWALADVTKMMKDVVKRYWYTLKMTPEERVTEAAALKEKYTALDTKNPERQEIVDQYELMIGRLRNVDGGKITEILTGMGRAAGTQRSFIDNLRDTVEDGLSDTKLKDLAYGAGQTIARFDNVLNPIWEAWNAFTNDMRIVETKAETPMESKIGVAGQALLAPVLAPVPGAKSMFPSKPSVFKEEEQRVPLIARQFLGIKPEVPTTKIENELVRLGIQPYRAYKTSGNRDYDMVHIKESQKLLKMMVESEIDSSRYKKASMNTQSKMVNDKIKEVFNITKPIADAKFQGKSPDKAIDIAYDKLPKAVRQSAEDIFFEKEGRRPETPKEKQAIMFGGSAYAKGGLASRR